MTPSRRDFLGTATGLLLGIVLPGSGKLEAQGRGSSPNNPDAYIHIGTDDWVTFTITKNEMGQGTITSLSQLLAEELDCEWQRVRTVMAPVNPGLYGFQGVFGSQSIRTQWTPLRQAGATARAMLMEAAARQWGVEKSTLRTANGSVINPATGSTLLYSKLTGPAAQLPVPGGVPLKNPKDFRLIGKSVKRLDTVDKSTGRAQFGLDAKVPGMVYASLLRCPVFGGKVVSFDAAKAKAVPGVRSVVRTPQGVAVIADNTWNAMQGRKALEPSVRFEEGPVARVSSAGIRKMFADYAQQPGAVARQTGNADQALAGAAKKLEAVYEAPYLSHAPMEPMNCTAVVNSDSCEIWAPTQMQAGASSTASQLTGLPPAKIRLNSMLMGGGFGRRGSVDYIAEAIEIAKTVPGTPVKLTWTREEDMRHDLYRPASYVKFSGACDSDGWPVALKASVACPSFAGGRDAVDHTAVEGIDTIEYTIPNLHVDWRKAEPGIPTTYWRAVGYTQNTFFAESFLDELAAAGKKDPVELRRRLLGDSPRLRAVLDKIAEKSDWGRSGHAQGVALVNNIGSFTGMVADVSVDSGKLKVHRIVCAVDCGRIVNPAIITQQIESGIVFGLSAALKGAITIDKGRVQQSNFNTYDVLRIDEMPKIDVHIIETDNHPGGIGEAAVPPVAPAIANAIFAAAGKRIRRLPIRPEDLA